MMYNISLSINFKDKPTRDKLFEDIRKNQPAMLQGHSTFSKHLCTHDVLPYQPCTPEETITVPPPQDTP